MRACIVGLLAAAALVTWAESAKAEEAPLDLGDAQWIWSPDQARNKAPVGSCYFRRTIFVGTKERPGTPERGRLEITADDQFEAYLNGRKVAEGKNFRELQVVDVTRYLQPGSNVLAIKVDNTAIGPAGLAARITVKQVGNTDVQTWTDNTWKVTNSPGANWAGARYNDNRWSVALSLGALGSTAPWNDAVRPKKEGEGGRFRIMRGFAIERIARPEQTESLVAMTFDPRGRIIAARERGPLVVIADDDADGRPDVKVLSDKVLNCQGILAYRNYLYVVGDGPVGTAFYQLTDEKNEGTYEKIGLMFKFEGGMSEHGPHAPVLGPDGLIYLVSGNHVKPAAESLSTDPYNRTYEGDLVQPRYEDPGGHAVGIKAPGGVVLRSTLDGKKIETFVGGLRNSYDLAFNRAGDMFTFESDMEWDDGLPWYRPTRVLHLSSGGDFGWRSGWAKRPDYYIDTLPSVLEVGRGSPSGLAFYDHHKFPAKYRGAMFVCDWSMGRISAVLTKPQGASYTGQIESFLEGRPLNATDIDVGPDGWLYFCTGGRSTEGGVFRVVWTGQQDAPPPSSGILAALHQPQPMSAWAMKRVEQIKTTLGAEWPKQLSLAAQDGQKYSAAERVRALEIMQTVGPPPAKDFLILLSKDQSPEVRQKAAYLMGVHTSDETNARLNELMQDPVATVRRTTLESIERSGIRRLAPSRLVAMLGDSDRHVATAARNLLKQISPTHWQNLVLQSKDVGVFTGGCTALLAVDHKPETAQAVITRSSQVLKGYVSDEDFLDLLRVMQLALHLGEIKPADAAALRTQLAAEFPLPTVKNPAVARHINRELVRLLAYLNSGASIDGLLAFMYGKEPFTERMHAGCYAQAIQDGWSTEQKLKLLAFYEDARIQPAGNSFGGYLDNMTKEFVNRMTEEQWIQVLAYGSDLPSSAVFVLGKLPADPGDEFLQYLIDLDDGLASTDSAAGRKLQVAISAVLARSKQPKAMAHLRAAFKQAPSRRETLALALAQEPEGENWPLLVESLPVLEGTVAQEVLDKLASVNRSPEQPQAYRQVILKALQLGEDGGGKTALQVLDRWTGESLAETDDYEATVAAWQAWFKKSYPDLPPAEAEVVSNRYTTTDILEFLTSGSGQEASAQRGAVVFEKASCVKCHRFDGRGEAIGPDLTNVSRRFHIKEVLSSVLSPSQVISDQYASKTVVTLAGKTYTGIVGAAGDQSVVVLQTNGEKQIVEKNDIEQIVPSSKSAMPESLFNNLTLDEIADLIAFLMRSGPTATTASGPATPTN